MAAQPLGCQDKPMEKQKAERLAAALRENLKKRKAQARNLSDQAGSDSQGNGDRNEDTN
jgi:hypothetical protein